MKHQSAKKALAEYKKTQGHNYEYKGDIEPLAIFVKIR
jgi:hypothetical protein